VTFATHNTSLQPTAYAVAVCSIVDSSFTFVVPLARLTDGG